MKEISSAESFIEMIFQRTEAKDYDEIIESCMIEFAKLHVQAVLEAAAGKSKINVEAKFRGETRNTTANSYFYDFKEMGGKRNITVDKDSILNAYDLNLIK